MIKSILAVLVAGCLCLAGHGCTYRAWYDGFKEQQRLDCYRLASQHAVQQCLEKVDSQTYEQYVKEREAMKRRSK